MFPTNTNYWKTSSFVSEYTRAEILTEIGYTETDLALTAWRTQNFYRAIKAMMPYVRYVKVPTSESYTSLDYLSNPSYTGAEPANTISDAWDDAVNVLTSLDSPAYGLRPHEIGTSDTFYYRVRKTSSDSTTITATVYSPYNSGTVVNYEARASCTFSSFNSSIALGTVNGDLAGNSFSFDLSTQSATDSSLFVFSDSSPTLSVSIDSSIFSVPDVTLLFGSQVEFGFGLNNGIIARMDMSTYYSYP